MTMQTENKPLQPTTRRIIGKLVLLVVVMFGFGFALVPLYDVFCDVTGLNGKTGGKVNFTSAPVVDEKRLVKVTFLASLNESMPWKFRPQQTSVEVHPGQPTTITYIAKNNASYTITGQAVPSVAPGLAAAYFQKTECFCFTQQALKPGEEKVMPVTFIVDSQLPEDMNELTLSYTFFISKKDNQEAPSSLAHNQDHKL
ncbi:Cytochrome oxidase biogenesis protein Cox11-CtaG, copper delivery to Cox1 [hydrothermal vent metagenome]|uniref:Cytochrome oxidase biogenesis protein Cox11-CtaG, copper delivery to Cox1 n=1 Tax=hydrothermal vent metagenome TaxID=652676 RepID=A0A3B0X5R7_9ZZZZ